MSCRWDGELLQGPRVTDRAAISALALILFFDPWTVLVTKGSKDHNLCFTGERP